MKKRIFAIILAFTIFFTASCTDADIPSESTKSECIAPAHIDTNSDGYCDFCLLALSVTVDFYVINDLHGKLLDGELIKKIYTTNSILTKTHDMIEVTDLQEV